MLFKSKSCFVSKDETTPSTKPESPYEQRNLVFKFEYKRFLITCSNLTSEECPATQDSRYEEN